MCQPRASSLKTAAPQRVEVALVTVLAGQVEARQRVDDVQKRRRARAAGADDEEEPLIA